MHGRRKVVFSISVELVDEASALALLRHTSSFSWRQCPAYAAHAALSTGAESQYVVLRDGAAVAALVNLRIKRLPGVSFGLALISHGPVFFEGYEDRQNEMMAALREHLVNKERLILRASFPLGDLDRDKVPDGFRKLVGTGYSTFVVDLEQSENRVLSALHSKWRSDLRRAQQSEVTITRSTDPADFRRLQPLLNQLSSEKGFTIPQDANFFAEIAAKAAAPERFAVHLAWLKGRILAGHIGAYSGDTAVYLLGASNQEGRDARSAFLLQWEAIKYAKSLGLKRYDLGGVDHLANPDVYRFKKRMGGRFYEGPDMIEATASWPYGQITKLAERAHRFLAG